MSTKPTHWHSVYITDSVVDTAVCYVTSKTMLCPGDINILCSVVAEKINFIALTV